MQEQSYEASLSQVIALLILLIWKHFLPSRGFREKHFLTVRLKKAPFNVFNAFKQRKASAFTPPLFRADKNVF